MYYQLLSYNAMCNVILILIYSYTYAYIDYLWMILSSSFSSFLLLIF